MSGYIFFPLFLPPDRRTNHLFVLAGKQIVWGSALAVPWAASAADARPPSWICKCRDNSLPLWQASLTEALGFSWAACWQACLAVGGWLFSCTGWAVGVRTERLRQLNVLLFNPGCNNNTETCGILSSNCQALVPKMKYVCKEVALLSEVLSTSSSWSFSGLVRAQGCKNQEAKKSGSKHRPRNRAQLLDLLF